MSAPISDEVKNVVGTIEERHITTGEETHHRITWAIENFTSSVGKELRSPMFTVPGRDRCKWYFSIQFIFFGPENNIISCSVRLVLDSTSDCKAAITKFRLYTLPDEQKKELWRTFQFTTKSEHSIGILSSFNKSAIYIVRRGRWDYCLTVACDILIESILHEDDIFSTDFGYLLKNQLFTDVVLSVGEKKYPAHKAILATRSSVFAAMFAHNMTENQGVVHIKDLDEEVVEEMVRYIYTGEAEKLNDLAEDLLKAADKYDLKGLRIRCENILITSLSSSNAFDLLLLAESYNASELRSEAIYFITVRSTHLMKTPAWESICQSRPELLREISEALLSSRFAAEAK